MLQEPDPEENVSGNGYPHQDANVFWQFRVRFCAEIMAQTRWKDPEDICDISTGRASCCSLACWKRSGHKVLKKD